MYGLVATYILLQLYKRVNGSRLVAVVTIRLGSAHILGWVLWSEFPPPKTAHVLDIYGYA